MSVQAGVLAAISSSGTDMGLTLGYRCYDYTLRGYLVCCCRRRGIQRGHGRGLILLARPRNASGAPAALSGSTPRSRRVIARPHDAIADPTRYLLTVLATDVALPCSRTKSNAMSPAYSSS